MKTHLIKFGLTALALLLGQQAFAHQNAPLASEPMMYVEVVTPASPQAASLDVTAIDKAALEARIKQDSLEMLKQTTSRSLLQKQVRQSLVPASKALQASL